MFKGKIKWTKKKTEYLLKNYNSIPLKQICRKLNISECAVRRKMKKLNIKRNSEIIEKFRKKSQFKKGHIPANKGKKGTHFSPATEFKKGHMPANTLYDGCIRMRHNYKRKLIYLVIRIAPMKWISLNRYIWEKHYGPIPKGYNIIYKDGNPLNVTIENLKMINNQENARRNSNYGTDKYVARTIFKKEKDIEKIIKKYPELIDLKRYQLELRRYINERGR